MKQLFYLKVTSSMADKLVTVYKDHINEQGMNYYQISNAYLANTFNQFIFEKYNATFDSSKNNMIFTSEKNMNWFILQL